MAKEGENAPDFKLDRDGGETVRLADFRGKYIVLFFYPKDDTSGCTKEAIAFSAVRDEFEQLNAVILGASPDSVASHEKFIKKHDLKMPLLSDEDKKLVEAYGVWVEKNMYGRKYMGVERATFLIDPKGKIIRVWRKVKVKDHEKSVLKALRDVAG